MVTENQHFNEILFKKLKDAGANVTIKDIETANLPRDKDSFTNSYWITDKKLFFAIVDNFFFNEVFRTGYTLEKVDDVERGVYAYGSGPATWECEDKTNEFETGYISMYALDRYLGIQDV